MRRETWINRYAARMAAGIGTWAGCFEAADAAWDDCADDHSPEEAADNEVAEWRRLMAEEDEG